MDPLKLLSLPDEATGLLEDLQSKIEKEEVSSNELFQLILQNFKADLLTEYPEVRCGVVLCVSVQSCDRFEGAEIWIDLKSDKPRIFSELPASGSGLQDVTILFQNEVTFRGIASKRLDFMQAYRSNLIKVEGSWRSKMNLMKLMNLGERLQKELAQKEFAALDISNLDNAQLSGKKEGYLLKKSEWLKSWNKRFFQLEWDEYHRPVLSYYLDKNESPKGVIELHSSFKVEPRPSTPNAFNLINMREGLNSFALCATSHEDYLDWVKSFKAAISARSRASKAMMKNSPRNLSMFKKELAKEDPIQQMSVAEKKELEDTIVNLKARLTESGTESNMAFVLRKLNWRILPLGYIGVVVYEALTYGAHNVLHLFSTSIPHLLPSHIIDSYMSSKLATLVLVIGISLLLRWMYNAKRFELFRRRWTVYTIAIRIILDLKITKMKTEELPQIHSNAVWNVKQISIAEEIYRHSLRLGGLWVKAAQHIGARPDTVPGPVINVLSRLQDQVPPTPFIGVKGMIENELGCPLEEKFRTFDQEPLAAASIGQVHKAVLHDGSECVVKIQHPGVDRKIRQDIDNLGIILSWLTIIDSSFDLTPIFDAWRKDVINELDFRKEMNYMIKVGENMSRDDAVHASVPVAYEELSSQRMLIMRYVSGAKLTDADALISVGVVGPEARSQLAKDICNAFGHQLFIDGLFNADPHPGNILVALMDEVKNGEIVKVPKSLRPIPVLLDFGLSSEISDPIRLAFSRMVYAGGSVDIAGLLTAGDELNVKILKEDFMEVIGAMEFIFRETAPPEESMARVKQRIELEKKKWHEGEDGKKPPIDINSFPPEFILFFRTLDLLRGLCSSLEVRHPFIDTMASWAKRALLKVYSYDETKLRIDHTSYSSKLDKELRMKLVEKDLKSLGIQLTVIENDEIVSQISSGVLSDVDYRNVEDSTLFSALSISQAVSQMAVLSYITSETIQSIQTKLSTLFGYKASKSNPSIEDILCGDLERYPGDPSQLPEKITSKNLRAECWNENLEYAKNSLQKVPAFPKARSIPWEFSHTAFSWGWSIGCIAESCAASKHKNGSVYPAIKSMIHEKLCDPFNLQGEIVFGLENAKDAIRRGKIARAFVPVREILKENGIENLSTLLNEAELNKITGNKSERKGPGLEIISDSMPGLKGREFWADPRLYTNYPPILESCLPATNVLCTSRALARLFHTFLVKNGKIANSSVIRPEVCNLLRHFAAGSGDFKTQTDPFDETKLGLKKFKYAWTKKNPQDDSKEEEIEAYGCFALGGSLVVSIPKLQLTFSILTNRLTLNRDVIQEILNIVYSHYQLVPLGDY